MFVSEMLVGSEELNKSANEKDSVRKRQGNNGPIRRLEGAIQKDRGKISPDDLYGNLVTLALTSSLPLRSVILSPTERLERGSGCKSSAPQIPRTGI
jgi:hypothetical protein